MGPLAGVMVCDYYLIKKQKLNIHELYKDRGIYWYDHGFNWRAFAAFVVGFGPCMPGFAKSIQHNLDVGGAWQVRTSHTCIVSRLNTDEMVQRSCIHLPGFSGSSFPSRYTMSSASSSRRRQVQWWRLQCILPCPATSRLLRKRWGRRQSPTKAKTSRRMSKSQSGLSFGAISVSQLCYCDLLGVSSLRPIIVL
jgi:hypothetical protein